MSEYTSFSIKPGQFLRVGSNILYRCFFEGSRADAKRLFREIEAGRVVSLLQLELEDSSLLDVELVLDRSEYRGRLAFSGFRRQLRLLLAQIARALETVAELPALMSSEQGDSHIFNVPAISVEDGQANVLMLGTATSRPGAVRLQLLYLDPEQFRREASADANLPS